MKPVFGGFETRLKLIKFGHAVLGTTCGLISICFQNYQRYRVAYKGETSMRTCNSSNMISVLNGLVIAYYMIHMIWQRN